jgi:hypothetical protein
MVSDARSERARFPGVIGKNIGEKILQVVWSGNGSVPKDGRMGGTVVEHSHGDIGVFVKAVFQRQFFMQTILKNRMPVMHQKYWKLIEGIEGGLQRTLVGS